MDYYLFLFEASDADHKALQGGIHVNDDVNVVMNKLTDSMYVLSGCEKLRISIRTLIERQLGHGDFMIYTSPTDFILVEHCTKNVNVEAYSYDYWKILDDVDLFLGNKNAVCNEQFLKNNNIKVIFNFGYCDDVNVPNSVRSMGVKVYDYNIPDSYDTKHDIAQYFEPVTALIDEHLRAGNGVLVNCYAGISRSVTIMIAYLVKYHDKSLAVAKLWLQDRRPAAEPNSTFMDALRKWEIKCRGRCSIMRI